MTKDISHLISGNKMRRSLLVHENSKKIYFFFPEITVFLPEDYL